MLQKNNCNFYLILWQNVPVFNLSKRTDIEVSSQEVKLILNTPVKMVNIYQTINSVKPIKQYNNSQELTVDVPDYPLIIEIVPD